MKKYRTLANNYIKRNAYANNTLGYYRKPIFIACISFIIMAICSLLIYQVTHIEKSERKKTVLCTMLLWDDKPIMTTKDEELTEKFNIYFFNTKVDVNNIEIINTLDSLGFERTDINNNEIITYKNMTILYTENGERFFTSYNTNYKELLKDVGWL